MYVCAHFLNVYAENVYTIVPKIRRQILHERVYACKSKHSIWAKVYVHSTDHKNKNRIQFVCYINAPTMRVVRAYFDFLFVFFFLSLSPQHTQAHSFVFM